MASPQGETFYKRRKRANLAASGLHKEGVNSHEAGPDGKLFVHLATNTNTTTANHEFNHSPLRPHP